MCLEVPTEDSGRLKKISSSHILCIASHLCGGRAESEPCLKSPNLIRNWLAFGESGLFSCLPVRSKTLKEQVWMLL